jgi:hypothetical protein
VSGSLDHGIWLKLGYEKKWQILWYPFPWIVKIISYSKRKNTDLRPYQAGLPGFKVKKNGSKSSYFQYVIDYLSIF